VDFAVFGDHFAVFEKLFSSETNVRQKCLRWLSALARQKQHLLFAIRLAKALPIFGTLRDGSKKSARGSIEVK
jgi:hypothetical protein